MWKRLENLDRFHRKTPCKRLWKHMRKAAKKFDFSIIQNCYFFWFFYRSFSFKTTNQKNLLSDIIVIISP